MTRAAASSSTSTARRGSSHSRNRPTQRPNATSPAASRPTATTPDQRRGTDENDQIGRGDHRQRLRGRGPGAPAEPSRPTGHGAREGTSSQGPIGLQADPGPEVSAEVPEGALRREHQLHVRGGAGRGLGLLRDGVPPRAHSRVRANRWVGPADLADRRRSGGPGSTLRASGGDAARSAARPGEDPEDGPGLFADDEEARLLLRTVPLRGGRVRRQRLLRHGLHLRGEADAPHELPAAGRGGRRLGPHRHRGAGRSAGR